MPKDHGIRISMDGKGCWRDNVLVERLWKTIKFEEIYLRACNTVCEVRTGLNRYIRFYNQRRPYKADGRVPPDYRYYGLLPQTAAA